MAVVMGADGGLGRCQGEEGDRETDEARLADYWTWDRPWRRLGLWFCWAGLRAKDTDTDTDTDTGMIYPSSPNNWWSRE